MKGKIAFRILFIMLFVVSVFAANFTYGNDTITGNAPGSFSAPKFELEGLEAEVFSDGKILFVGGKIRNKSFDSVQGYVIVYLRDKNNGVIASAEVDVNKKAPFSHGDAGIFEVTLNIENIPGIENISIEFVDKK